MIRRLLALLGVVVSVMLLARAAGAVAPVLRPSAEHPVVVLGVEGLTWDQIDPKLPALDALAHAGATGVLAGRGADEKTSTLDAWATLSAGNRARARNVDPAVAPDVAAAQRQTDPARTGARIGALPDAMAPDCLSHNAGAGATLASANSTGALPPPGAACPVRLLEVSNPAQAESLVRVWQPEASLLLVVGLGDDVAPAHLHVAIASGTGFSGGRLTSGSTRRVPYVQLVDVAPTILATLGRQPPPSMIGERWRVADAKPLDRDAYLQADRRARFMPTAVVGVVVPLVAGFVLTLVAAAGLGWRGRRRAAWSVAVWDCRIVAAIPVATFLARLVPYESLPNAALRLAGLWALVLALDAVVLVTTRARIGWIAALTAVVLGIDVLLGARLQLHSVLGYSALVAGRFAGLGNPAFGAFAAAVLVTATVLARAHPRRAVLAVVGVGLAAVVIDGAPMLGSDVGGVLALVPAFALLAWSAGGRRIRVRTVVLAGLGAVAVIVLFAAVDLARAPESRTHLGRFASQLLHGQAGETLSRKAAANWDLLTRNAVTLLVLPTLAVLAVVLARADRWQATAPLGRALREEFLLRTGLAASLVAGLLGFAVNDSGVVVPAVMMLIVVPAAMEAAALHRTTSPGPVGREMSAGSESGPGLVRRVAPAGRPPDVP